MNGLTLENLERCIKSAQKEHVPFLVMKIQMEDFEKPEIIINPIENYDTKLAYYKKAYNENLVLKSFSGIRIIEFGFAWDFEDIQNDFVKD